MLLLASVRMISRSVQSGAGEVPLAIYQPCVEFSISMTGSPIKLCLLTPRRETLERFKVGLD